MKIRTHHVNLYYNDFHALKGITIEIAKNTVTEVAEPAAETPAETSSEENA
jgi:ABC-type phosphate transport system ATPase subunit